MKMRTNHKLTLAVLTGVSIGVAGAHAIHAQQVKTPPGYVSRNLDLSEPRPLSRP